MSIRAQRLRVKAPPSDAPSGLDDDPCGTIRSRIQELQSSIANDHDLLSAILHSGSKGGPEVARLQRELNSYQTQLGQQQRDLAACLAASAPLMPVTWALEGWAAEDYPSIQQSGGWNLTNEEGNEGRVRSSVAGFNVDPPANFPALPQLISLVSNGSWCVPPGKSGYVSLSFALEQAILAVVDVDAAIARLVADPSQLRSPNFLEQVSLWTSGQVPSSSGDWAVELPGPAPTQNGPARYFLFAATSPNSSGWVGGPTLQATYEAQAWSCTSVIDTVEISAGAPNSLGDVFRHELAARFALPSGIQAQHGGTISTTSGYQVRTTGYWDGPAGPIFILTDGPRLLFSGSCSPEVAPTASRIYPVLSEFHLPHDLVVANAGRLAP